MGGLMSMENLAACLFTLSAAFSPVHLRWTGLGDHLSLLPNLSLQCGTPRGYGMPHAVECVVLWNASKGAFFLLLMLAFSLNGPFEAFTLKCFHTTCELSSPTAWHASLGWLFRTALAGFKVFKSRLSRMTASPTSLRQEKML